ncbi:hypothetical protein PILCRDRAFT_179340 [Piloderma croceum F 1598]|uniref:Uncharacterized protein n=1 Tax=Piloderma croceum (strain F 1598) TaxID=765440 RepID=A0A0C3BUS5_PILCF|nr:hypothetical protein PILCRDRAFT_179340 [Piloderma croceum F 1598]
MVSRVVLVVRQFEIFVVSWAFVQVLPIRVGSQVACTRQRREEKMFRSTLTTYRTGHLIDNQQISTATGPAVVVGGFFLCDS